MSEYGEGALSRGLAEPKQGERQTQGDGHEATEDRVERHARVERRDSRTDNIMANGVEA